VAGIDLDRYFEGKDLEELTRKTVLLVSTLRP
jgi:hypothetical protein